MERAMSILPPAASPVARYAALVASVSRLHIVAIGALGTFTFGWLFTGRYLWLLAGVCSLDWFLVNILNRVVDVPEDTHNRIAGTDFVSRHRRAILALGFGLLFGSLVAVHVVEPTITPLRVAFHALGLAYNWPLLPGRRRIKQLYFWKNTASATGFMITVFGYPLAGVWLGTSTLAAGITVATILFSAAFFFAFELSYEVIYDLRDRGGDAALGVLTYPVVHGERGAVRIVDGLLVVSLASLVVGYWVGAVPWRIAVMGAAPALQFVLYKRSLARGITSSDCVRITWLGAGLLAAYHLWVLARLPGVGS
jgi:4-hydroxybenzoate polyprenyltransferase